MTTNSILEFKGTSKIYKTGFWGRQQLALSALKLSVPQGSIYGFLGANGAGKTTAIKILLGLQFPTAGEVFLWGKPSQLAENKRRIGYLPERPYFHDTMSATEFLNFHRALFGRQQKGKKSTSNEELLALVGIPDVGSKRLRDFSKGMLQRIGIAQALVNDPELVILDEPMSGLDPVGRRDIRNLIQFLSKQGKTIFFSSHILSDVEALCHRIAFLEKGVLKFEGRVEEILRDATKAQEILFQADAKLIRDHSLLKKAEPLGEIFKISAIDPAEVRSIVEAVWQLNGQLISVQSQHLTLEQALFGKELK